MAIDPHPPTSPVAPGPRPVIDNEFPAYRAISGAAVASLLLGLTSILCFADYRFLGVAAAAVILGILASRKIARLSDILTGKRMAEVGMALGLVFAISSVTVGVASDLVLRWEVSKFANSYVKVLKDDPLAVAIWFQQPPDSRKAKSPDDILNELRNTKGGPPGNDPYSERTTPILKIKNRIGGKGESIRYAKLESKYTDGLTQYANALLDLDGPGSTEFPEKEEFALLELVKSQGVGKNDWMVKEVRYPYKPLSTIAAPAPKDDDGHGHGH